MHWYGFWPVWMRLCISRWCFCNIDFWHVLHWYGFSTVWVPGLIMFCWKLFLQVVHWYIFVPVCICRCRNRLYFCEHTLLHLCTCKLFLPYEYTCAYLKWVVTGGGHYLWVRAVVFRAGQIFECTELTGGKFEFTESRGTKFECTKLRGDKIETFEWQNVKVS